MNYKNNRYEIRSLLLKTQPNCVYCNCKLSNDSNKSLNFATLEHIVPQSRMGDHSVENLTLACPTCNSMRSSSDSFVGFQFKGSDINSFQSKEDISKILQVINLQKNLVFYNKIKKLANNGKELLSFLQSHKTIGVIKHILTNIIIDSITTQALKKMVNFINHLIFSTNKQMNKIKDVMINYNIELTEFTILDYGLIKQSY